MPVGRIVLDQYKDVIATLKFSLSFFLAFWACREVECNIECGRELGFVFGSKLSS